MPHDSGQSPPEMLLTTAQAARALQTSPRQLFRLRENGIPFIKLGTSVRYPVDALRKWIADQQAASAAA